MSNQLQIDANNAYSEKGICTNVPMPKINEVKWASEMVTFGKKATLIVNTEEALGCKILVKFRSLDWSSCFVDVYDVNSSPSEEIQCEFTPKTNFLIDKSKIEVEMYADIWLLQPSPWGIYLTTIFLDRIKNTYNAFGPLNQYSTIPKRHLDLNITECSSTSAKCTVKKIVIVLDPGHGHTRGRTGTNAWKYSHAIKDAKGEIKKNEEGDVVIQTSTFRTIPDYVYSNDEACKKWQTKLFDRDRECDAWYERDIVFEIAELMKPKLEEAGYMVYMTRTEKVITEGNDDDNDAYARNRFSNEKNADYFISIHVNGNGANSAIWKRGAFYMYRKNDESEIIIRSKQLGISLVKYLKTNSKNNTDFIPVITDNNIQEKDIIVLSSDKINGNKAKYKSLVEIGTYTNPKDAVILYDNRDVMKITVAEQLVKGLLEHVNNYFS